MNLSQRQLRMFVTTAVLGNVSRASEHLHISQPALSRALQELESQLGVKLLNRSTRQMSLTHDGLHFLPVAQRLLHDLTEATQGLRERARGLSGSVTVAVGTAFGSVVLPTVLTAFSVSHPGVRIRLVDDNSAGITTRVTDAAVDLGIGSPVGDTGALECRLLLTATLGLLGDARRFSLGPRQGQSALAGLPLLNEPADTSIQQILRSRGSDLVTQMGRGTEVSSLSLQLALAQAGVGVAVLSALGASHPQAAGLRFVPIRPALRREVFLINRRDRPASPSVRAFAEAIAASLPLIAFHAVVRLVR